MRTLLLFSLVTVALAAPASKPPVITSLPFQGGEVLVEPGKPFTLRVAATGTPPLRFVWLKDGIELPIKSDTLEFDRFSPAHDGRYIAQVSGPGGLAVSEPVHLVYAGAAAVFERQAKQAAQRPGTSTSESARPGTSPVQPGTSTSPTVKVKRESKSP